MLPSMVAVATPSAQKLLPFDETENELDIPDKSRRKSSLVRPSLYSLGRKTEVAFFL